MLSKSQPRDLNIQRPEDLQKMIRASQNQQLAPHIVLFEYGIQESEQAAEHFEQMRGILKNFNNLESLIIHSHEGVESGGKEMKSFLKEALSQGFSQVSHEKHAAEDIEIWTRKTAMARAALKAGNE